MASNFRIPVPEATTNLFEDPSFEASSITTYWTVDGTAVKTTDDQWIGANAAKATVLSGTVCSIYRIISVTDTPYTIQAMVKRSGGGVVTNSTHTQARVSGLGALNWDSVQHIQDGWYLCIKTFTPAAGNRVIGIYLKEVDMLADALQLENKDHATTYCDGDMIGHRDRLSTPNEPLTGYAWTGTAHASTSTRHAQERSGGRVYDLTDLGVRTVLGLNGAGLVDPEHHITRYALLPGSTYKGKGIGERVFDIPLSFKGADLADLHTDRQALIDAISAELVTPDQPFTLRYTVDETTPKWLQIDGYYAGGLPGSTPQGTAEKAALRILSVSPYWRRLKQEVASLTVNTPGTVSNGGKLRALPILVIEGEGSIDSLANGTTGQTLTFNLFVNPGERIILDLERKTFVRKIGSAYTSIMHAHTGGRMNKWWLDRGDNEITVSASDSGSLVTESGDSLLTESGDSLITSSTLNITRCQLEFNETFESADGINS